MQLLFASGVRDVEYGILQFQLVLVVWFSFLISFSLLLHCCVLFFVRYRTERSPLTVPTVGLYHPSDAVAIAMGVLSTCYYVLQKFWVLIWVYF